MAASTLQKTLRKAGRVFAQRRLRVFWWLGVTPGLGLLQIWTLMFVIFVIRSIRPEIQPRLGNPDWGAASILGNSVLLFFATALIGQAIYTLWARGLLTGYHLFFAGAFLTGTLIAVSVLYVLTILFGKPTTFDQFRIEILFAVLVLIYAGYVELFID